MTNEQKLLAAYGASDERGKESILGYAISMAEDWPAPREQLLVGVAGLVDAGALTERELDDIESPPVVRPTV